jgi:hypothetical protein
VARRVQEGDLLVAVVDLVGADVLGDAARLARRHLRLPDGVQQRGLAVVDVAHDGDHGRARDEILVGVLERRLGVRLVGRVDDLDLLVELVRQHLDGVVAQRLRERGHLPQLHELLDDLGDGDAEVLRDVLDRGPGVDLDDVGLEHRHVLRHGLRVGAAPAPAAAPRRAPLGAAARSAAGTAARPAGAARAARGLGVDDHAAHAAGRAGGALALQRGARGPAPGTAALAARVLRALGRALAVGLGRRRGLRLGRLVGGGTQLGALGRAGAEVANAEVARRARPLLLGGGAVVARLLDLLARERGVGHRLVDRRGGSLDLDAGSHQLRHHL